MANTGPGKSIRLTPTVDYGDHEIFGTRNDLSRLIDQLKIGNDSECVVFAVGAFPDKEQWKIANLMLRDKRLTAMFKELDIKQARPMQRYCWPKIHKSRFANIFVSPEGTGKTYAHLLYAVSKCILSVPISRIENILMGDVEHHFRTAEESNPEDVINHPKYIIICSSQDNVDTINRTIECMKEKAYGIHATDSMRRFMPPFSRTINVHQDDHKLELRCNESDILIGTPPALLKCLQANYINFSMCKKVFFDDLDVALQLQNNSIREIVKIYLIQEQLSMDKVDLADDIDNRSCRMHLFSRKWTELVKQFMSTIFPQRIALFSSLAEAAIYSNIRFDVECYKSLTEKRQIISNLISVIVGRSSKDKIAVVCHTDDEAKSMTSALIEMGHKVKLMIEDDLNVQFKPQASRKMACELIFVISDQVLEFEVEFSPRHKPLNDVMHIIHASLPDKMKLFDQRFRLSFRNIQDNKASMTSTVLIGPDFDPVLAKQLYDLMSRSSQTLKASKLLVRDFISSNSNYICWRWATIGLCRLEKLSRDDRFGSYCPHRHSFIRDSSNNWPVSGLIRVTLTHIVSPSEFYFWFEAHKTPEDGKWIKLNRSGADFMYKMQIELNKLKSTETRSVPLSDVKKGKVYGVYFPQEARVDRVLLLEDIRVGADKIAAQSNGCKLNTELEYSKLVPVFKIDYGSNVEIVVKNLIALPETLSKIPPACHRGFHLGYKPTDNEPNWLYKSKKKFHETVTANSSREIYLWLRLNRDSCFWFENMLVTRRLINIDSTDVCTIRPHHELYTAGLADLATTEPPGLSKSTRLETMCKWSQVELKEVAQYAFLRRDIPLSDIVVLDVLSSFDVIVLQTTYKKQLDNLELELSNEFKTGQLNRQNYFDVDVYCIAKIPLKGIDYFNRVKIMEVYEQTDDIESPNCAQESRMKVYCLDHGDTHVVAKSNLYQASKNHLRILPFQAIKCKLANINEQLKSDRMLNVKARDLIVDVTRFPDNDDYRSAKCQLDEDGHLYLFVLNDEGTLFEPLSRLVSAKGGLQLHAQATEPCFENPITAEVQVDDIRADDRTEGMNGYILSYLRDIVVKELKDAGVESAA